MPRVPDGFTFTRSGRLRLLVRDGLPELTSLLERWASASLPPARALLGGRGGVGAFQLRPDLTAVLRPYRRGGLARRITSAHYFGLRPRPEQLAQTPRQRSHAPVADHASVDARHARQFAR